MVDHISVTASINLSTNILQAVYTVVDHIFGGVLASRVQCQHCGQVSSVYDSMNDLSVEVDDGLYGVVKSVEVALAKFIKPEVMSGDNAYHCDWCQRYCCCDACLVLLLPVRSSMSVLLCVCVCAVSNNHFFWWLC